VGDTVKHGQTVEFECDHEKNFVKLTHINTRKCENGTFTPNIHLMEGSQGCHQP